MIELDQGFAFGKGVFETIKVVQGKALFLEEHMDRLAKGLEFLSIDKQVSEEVEKFISNEGKKSYALKIMVSDKNTIFETRKDTYNQATRDRGLDFGRTEVLKNSTSSLIYHKTLCYYENILELEKAREAGFDEVLFVNERGLVTEGAISNVFFVSGSKILTPEIPSGLLPGTMRQFIIDEYGAEEVRIEEGEMADFNSAFASNSLMGITRINRIGNVKYTGSSVIDEISSRLKKLGF